MKPAVDYYLCRQSAAVFVLANKRGLDSKKFITKLFHSEVANVFYNNHISTNWLGESYVLSVLEEEIHFEKGETYSDDVMYWSGYLYRLWSLLYDDTPVEMVTQAPPEMLQMMFLGLHGMSYEMAIDNLKELYLENYSKNC